MTETVKVMILQFSIQKISNMSARKKFIIAILFLATIDWAIWVGGQFFNALMVIPGWSANVPASIVLYQQNILSHVSAYFFLVINPVFLLPLVITAWFFSFKYKNRFRLWFGIAAMSDLVIILLVGVWMAPTARAIFASAAHGYVDVSQMLSKLHTWKVSNGIRIGFGIITLFFFLVSISQFHLVKKS